MGKKLTKRIVAVLLVVFGCILGVTWNRTGFCIGDELFLAIGLPAWSNGSSGTHYPAIVGTILMAAGIGVLSSTLQQKMRQWLWVLIVALIVFATLFMARV